MRHGVANTNRRWAANKWHRRLGIVAAFGLFYLLATGLPLQFTHELRLGQSYVSNDWILDRYGFQAPETVRQSGAVVHIGDLVFVADTVLGQLDRLAGAIRTNEQLVVAGDRTILIRHDPAPDQPERVELGAEIEQLGQRRGSLFAQTSAGPLRADATLLNWDPVTLPADVEWAPVITLDAGNSSTYRQAFRNRMLSVERWLTDLHSGRFFGTMGVLLIDVLSLLLIVMATTGLVLWFRANRRP